MLYDIKVIYFDNTTKSIKSRIVQEYGLIQAIDQVRFDKSHAIFVVSANFVFEESLINNLK